MADENGSWELGGWTDWDGNHFALSELAHGDDRGIYSYVDELPTGDELGSLDYVQIHYTSDAGDDLWLTIHGPFDSYDDLDEAVDDALEAYG